MLVRVLVHPQRMRKEYGSCSVLVRVCLLNYHASCYIPGSYVANKMTLGFLRHFQGTVWRVIFMGANFRGKFEKALKINFRGFKFRDSNQSRGMRPLRRGMAIGDIAMARGILASFPGPSRGGGERAWYTLHAHAPGDPRKCGVIGYYRILSVYRP